MTTKLEAGPLKKNFIFLAASLTRFRFNLLMSERSEEVVLVLCDEFFMNSNGIVDESFGSGSST